MNREKELRLRELTDRYNHWRTMQKGWARTSVEDIIEWELFKERVEKRVKTVKKLLIGKELIFKNGR
jgi:hypothetical protein